MFHSFVVGITPDGRRVPLFVGTVGEARHSAEEACKAGGVVDGVFYRSIQEVPGAKATNISDFAELPGGDGPPEPQTPADSDRAKKPAPAGGKKKKAPAAEEKGDGEDKGEEDSGV